MLSQQRRPLYLAAMFALPVILILWVMWISGGWESTRIIVKNLISHKPEAYTQETFLHAVAERPLLRDLNPKAVQKYCARKTWPEDLVFYCHGIIGGIGSVRQQSLSCIRWAMAAGAAMVIPRPRPRRQTNSTLGEEVKAKYGGDVDPSHFFDKEGFKTAIHTMCPQMRIYDNSTLGELEGVKAEDIDNLGEFEIPRVYPWSEDVYRNTSETFLRQHPSRGNGSIRYAWLNRYMKASVICDDGEDFANSLGHLLPFRKDLVRMAGLILYRMSTQFRIKINPRDVSAPSSFAGVHLRTASDARFFGWLGYERQVALYKTYLAKQPVPVIYVASGNLTSINMFAERVQPTPVIDKFSMLPPADAMKLREMTWDQQGQVDYLVLSHSSMFLGMADSLFSMNIASARRAVSKAGTCGKVEAPAKGITYDDGTTVIVGMNHDENDQYQLPKYFWP